MFEGGEMIFKEARTDMYGHKKLGGIGDPRIFRIERNALLSTTRENPSTSLIKSWGIWSDAETLMP